MAETMRFMVKHNIPDKSGGVEHGFHKPGDVVAQHELAGADVGWLVRSGALQPLGDIRKAVLLPADPSKEELLSEVYRQQELIDRMDTQIEAMDAKHREYVEAEAERTKGLTAATVRPEAVSGAEDTAAELDYLRATVANLTAERDTLRERCDRYAANLTAQEAADHPGNESQPAEAPTVTEPGTDAAEAPAEGGNQPTAAPAAAGGPQGQSQNPGPQYQTRRNRR